MIDEEYIDNLGRLSTKEYIKRKESYEDKYDKLAAKLYEYGTYDDDLRSAAYETIVMHGGNDGNVDIVELKQLLDEYNEADIKFKEAREKHRRNMEMIDKIKRYGGSNDEEGKEESKTEESKEKESEKEESKEEKGEKEKQLEEARKLLEKIDQQEKQGLSDQLRKEIQQTLEDLGQNLNPDKQITDKELKKMLNDKIQMLEYKIQQQEKHRKLQQEQDQQLIPQLKEDEQQSNPPTIQIKEDEKELKLPKIETKKEQESTIQQKDQTSDQTSKTDQTGQTGQTSDQTDETRPIKLDLLYQTDQSPQETKESTTPTPGTLVNLSTDSTKKRVELYEKLIEQLNLIDEVYTKFRFDDVDDDIKKYDEIKFDESKQSSDNDLLQLIAIFESGPKKHYESKKYDYKGIPKDYHEDVRKLIDNEKLEIDDIKKEYDTHEEHGNYFIENLINGKNEVPSGYPIKIPIETIYLIEGKQSTDQRKQQLTRKKQSIEREKPTQSTRGRGRGRRENTTQRKQRKRLPSIPQQPTPTSPPQQSKQPSSSQSQQSIPQQPSESQPQKTGGF